MEEYLLKIIIKNSVIEFKNNITNKKFINAEPNYI